MSTKTRFEKEAKGNSEMAYSFSLYLYLFHFSLFLSFVHLLDGF